MGITFTLEERPDFSILDIQLPDVMGTEVLKMIRTSEIGPSIPIIAVNSYAMAGDREVLLDGGCASYIEKPTDPLAIIDHIRGVLGEAS